MLTRSPKKVAEKEEKQREKIFVPNYIDRHHLFQVLFSPSIKRHSICKGEEIRAQEKRRRNCSLALYAPGVGAARSKMIALKDSAWRRNEQTPKINTAKEQRWNSPGL